jgi:hypothetical protein
MAEYGYRHRLDTRTIFRSRLSRAQLTNQDRLRADETAALLDRFGRRYGAFRQSVSAASDPFAYEARVHIFARDRSLAAARRSEVGSRQHLRSMTESARENLILTHAFGATLEQSTFRWPKKLRAAVDAAQDPDTRYVSDAAGHLITWVSEPVLRTTMVAAIVLLGFADRLLGRRINSRRRRPEPE